MPGFMCEACNLHVNSQEQLIQHRNGKAHAKKLKSCGGMYAQDVAQANSVIDTSPGKRLYGKFVAASGMETQPPTPLSTNPPPPPPPPPPQPKNPNMIPIQTHKITTITTQTANSTEDPVNPVANAVIDNALGKLPLKRKAYEGKCDICDVSYTSESHKDQHLTGSKHAKKLKVSNISPDVPVVPLATFTGFSCQYCNVVVNSLQQLEAHRTGKKHKQAVEKLQKEGTSTDENKEVTTTMTPTTTL